MPRNFKATVRVRKIALCLMHCSIFSISSKFSANTWHHQCRHQKLPQLMCQEWIFAMQVHQAQAQKNFMWRFLFLNAPSSEHIFYVVIVWLSQEIALQLVPWNYQIHNSRSDPTTTLCWWNGCVGELVHYETRNSEKNNWSEKKKSLCPFELCRTC